MSRRTVATLLAGVLVASLWVVAWQRPVNFVVFSPGPTVNVLGASDGKRIITVRGHKSYRDDGGLRLVTIVSTRPDSKPNLLEAVGAWADPNRSVYPYDVIYAPQDTSTSVRQDNAQQMASSQDNAVAAALRVLKIPFTDAVTISSVDPSSPAKGMLEPGDLLLAVDGRATTGPEALVKAVRSVPPGSTLRLEIQRQGQQGPRTSTVRVPTVASRDDPLTSAIKVGIAPSYDFPFQVKLSLADNIGGPSAGMMFALGIVDVLTPGSLTDGKVVAGTGEIDGAGQVGPIGGIQQKLVGAQNDGARLFLVPAANCAEALGGNYDPSRMRLVRVSTLTDSVRAIERWTADPKADLPACTR